MEMRKLLFRKETKLVTLLLTSMLVASASAAVYYGMLARSTATVEAAPVYFTSGGDSSGVYTPGTNNTYASLTLKAYPNVTLYYEQAVNITASANKEVRLRHVSISPGDTDPSVSNFTSVVFKLLKGNGNPAGTLTYTTSGDNWNEPTETTFTAITNGEVWTIRVEITAAAGANTGKSVTIEIAVDVR